MSLGFNTESKSSGDILPIIKFDAKAGEFIKVDSEQTADGTWSKDQIELDIPFKVIMDLENIEVGWLAFPLGGPDFHMVKLGDKMPAQPTDEHKQAFRIKLFSKSLGVRVFSHSAKTVVRCMDALHTQYEAERAANPGKMPVVEAGKCETVKIQTPQGELRFKAPNWKIVSWVNAPDELSVAGTAPEPDPAPAAEDDDNEF